MSRFSIGVWWIPLGYLEEGIAKAKEVGATGIQSMRLQVKWLGNLSPAEGRKFWTH